MATRKVAEATVTEATVAEATVTEATVTEATVTEATVTEATVTEAPVRLTGRAKLLADIDISKNRQVDKPVSIGVAADRYVILDGPKSNESLTYFVIHADADPGEDGDRPIYWAKPSDLAQFDFATNGEWQKFAVTHGIPVIGSYFYSLDKDAIEVHPARLNFHLKLSAEKLAKKFATAISSRDPRWLKLRGLI